MEMDAIDVLTLNVAEHRLRKARVDYATAAQGAKADTALQETDIKESSTNGAILIREQDVMIHGLRSAAFQSVDYFDLNGAASEVLDASKAYTDEKFKINNKEIEEIKEIINDPMQFSNIEIAFEESDELSNIVTGDSLGNIFGKISKWYAWLQVIDTALCDEITQKQVYELFQVKQSSESSVTNPTESTETTV